MEQPFAHPISVAPMMRRTDRHFRFLIRQISRHTLLYTEMVPTGAILDGDHRRFLDFHPCESPLVLQIGGSDPDRLAACARIAEQWGYDGVNLNVCCPSHRVQNGEFGACLMGTPELVAHGVEAMIDATDLPVSVKHRFGIDDIDAYEDVLHFVDVVAEAGCRHFVVHARKAWLDGLSPTENRNIPPLRHSEVHRLKQQRPGLVIETNGGIETLDEAEAHLEHVDAVMIGRAAYDNPFLFADVDRRFYGDDTPPPTRREIVDRLCDYAQPWVEERGRKLNHLTRHWLQLFAGQPGARAWRHYLSEHAHRPDAGIHTLRDALAAVDDVAASVA